MKLDALFSHESVHWSTPEDLYQKLQAEFGFDDDPCPLHGKGGLNRPWGRSTYVNPPYGPEVSYWLKKAVEEQRCGKLVVFLLPVRTDTKWFHDLVLPHATEIRFFRGRLKFGGRDGAAPFPSMLIVFGQRNGKERASISVPQITIIGGDYEII